MQGKIIWVGRVLSGLVALMLLFSAAMKLKGGPELAQGMAKMGLRESMAVPLGLLELGVVVVYLIPQTSVLGAILVAGYMGGAMLTHWRVGEMFLIQFAIGVVAWLGLWLREPRLRSL
ncbi:MAG TPA: DoxX family protein, partial [Planctomycetota bacterium]|nr:DoxX family protein [Planctomycetota bacterium]